MLTKPNKNECPEYYDRYISLIEEDEDVLQLLADQIKEVQEVLGKLDDAQASHRYSEGKWSIKELIGHVVDTEWMLGNRALRFARYDETDVPQYDHDEYVANANFDKVPVSNLLQQFGYIRKAIVAMFHSFDDNMFAASGLSEGKSFTVRCFPYIIAGHLKHHLGILKERYLQQ